MRLADIKLAVVKTPNITKGIELKFAESELKRQLPAGVAWHRAADGYLLDSFGLGSTDLVLVLAHPWISLDRHCLDRLANSLALGYDIVEACDSSNFSPMQPPDYATLRGMERYVDQHGSPSTLRIAAGAKSSALLQLMTADVFARHGDSDSDSDLITGRVFGAYLHDVSGYFSGDRSDVIAMIPDATRVCLDVGGGLGNFLKLAKAQLGVETHLVELDSEIAEQARAGKCADFVSSGDFLQYSATSQFDCITFLDMLEHVGEPERYLLHAKKLLSAGGVVIASIPNVGHWSVVVDLLEGRWDYASAGIQCVTHLRFFTLKSILELFDRSGFAVERTERVLVPCPPRWSEGLQRVDGLTLDADSLNTYAYLVVGRPSVN